MDITCAKELRLPAENQLGKLKIYYLSQHNFSFICWCFRDTPTNSQHFRCKAMLLEAFVTLADFQKKPKSRVRFYPQNPSCDVEASFESSCFRVFPPLPRGGSNQVGFLSKGESLWGTTSNAAVVGFGLLEGASN
jgi:hypothetical protein